MKFKYGVFCITLRLIVLLPSYSVATEVIAGNVINFEISRDGLQGKMEKLVAKQGIDEKSKAKEMSWYQLADENIADTRWYEFYSSEYQNVLKSAPEQLKKSKNKLKVKVYKVSDQQTEIVFSDDGKTVTYAGQNDVTALVLLESGTTVTTEDSDFGEFVVGINGVEADSSSQYWSFYVGGEYATEGAGTYVTSDGEQITWELEDL